MGKKINVTFYASTGYVGSKTEDTVEVDEDEWNKMNNDEKASMMHEVLYNLDIGWYVKEGEENE